ncbi:MAG: galactose ABC transporter substrate-binding protein [Clostridium sp.]
MRKVIKNLWGVVLTVLAFNSFVSCSVLSNVKNVDSSIDEIKIGVTLYKQDDTFISTISTNIEKVARKKELENNYKITVNFLDAKGSQSNQNDQVDRFILQEYDVICVNMVDRTASAVIIDKAKAAGIPVIFFNREPVEEDMQRWNKVYYVGANAEQSGEMQANIIMDMYNNDKISVDKNGDGKIQYVMLEGEQGHQDTLIRTEYCIKTIRENEIGVEKLANDTANWQRGQGSTRMTQWIKDFGNKIEVVFSNNDDMALGAIDALNNLNITSDRPLVVGVDATPQALESIENEELTGTVISDSLGQATAIFDIAYTLAIGDDVNKIYNIKDSRYIKTNHTYITKENVDLYLEK